MAVGTWAPAAPGGDAALVVAARGGDRAALEALVRGHLPLVYNLVRQALGARSEVDDVVQEVLLRAVRELPKLRAPESFRAWLAAITVRQVGTYAAKADRAAERIAPLEDAAWKPGADAEEPALLRLEMAQQRRQVKHAGRWLSADERAVLSLWWLETAGELTRAELAAALRVRVGHAGVRVRRMREQLELSRSIVAALEAVPGCDRLSAAIADWNGVPGPFWRKRIARHVRSCAVCGPAGERMIPAERLLAGLVAVPAAVDKAVVEAIGGAVTATASGIGLKTALAGAVTVGALTVGLAVAAGEKENPDQKEQQPTVTQSQPPPLSTGKVSLESANQSGRYVAILGDAGVLTDVSNDTDRKWATFEVVPGLADRQCYSLLAADGRHLRHLNWRLRASGEQNTVLSRRDATFCARAGWSAGTVALESYNYRGWFLRHTGGEMWVDQFDGSAEFGADGSFLTRPPLD